MRLTCPNCGAEYEVPDEVIPAAGRDVQCSNCGDTWFQYHPDHQPAAAEPAPAPASDPDTAPDATPERADAAPTVPDDEPENFEFQRPTPAAEAEDLDDDFDDEDAYDDDPPMANAPAARRRSLDPAVQSILREEAEYEERVRGQETLESQPELGLTEPDAPRPDASAQSLRIKPGELLHSDEEPDHGAEGAAAAAAGASRRNLLPDIEEINSSLRRKGDNMRSATRTGHGAAREMQRGTRRGFITVLTLLAVAATLYLQAPAIGNAVAPLKPMMTAYVDAVDRGRAWLDQKATSLAAKLDDMASDSSDTPAPTE